MNSTTLRIALPLAAALGMFAQGASAKLSAAEAAQLGKDLTCFGAEKGANKDASIPAFGGKWLGAVPGLQAAAGKRYADPYAVEKPLFTITAKNAAQYADRLSAGEKALLEKYPDSFSMPVYPSHRDFRYADWNCETTRKNAVTAEVVDDAMGVKSMNGGIPFPIPKTGDELLWNMKLPLRVYQEDATFEQAVVYPNGNIAWGKVRYEIMAPTNHPDAEGKPSDGLFAYAKLSILAPERNKGEVILSHSFFNEKVNPTVAWQYNPGTRRVRQSPGYGFDMPLGPGGFRTVDDDRLFNGSGERYSWKLAGKREIYIPYNAYRLEDPKYTYKAMLQPGSINPEPMRYELHRVWVLEGTLKEGYRHQYAKRVMYIDEDSWIAVLADNYDARGQLWRTNMLNTYYAYDAKVFHAGVALYHDLVSGAYMADRLTNEGTPPILNGDRLKDHMMTVDALRQAGK
ncbi:MAG TPA: DUF1329 domain-containing protein [Aromatoleum sp.]|uniref:DUF1329 domain-containing protein n=1 Tax=Aromatoleum sp. TaxID=2307007 RepID=UPI002B495542|nr:DUF1329 domain-containing protein [Aromatoleum sp.]HJV27660.1 DUF1329 domain-containing protein [Aromatoleum sp.]